MPAAGAVAFLYSRMYFCPSPHVMLMVTVQGPVPEKLRDSEVQAGDPPVKNRKPGCVVEPEVLGAVQPAGITICVCEPPLNTTPGEVKVNVCVLVLPVATEVGLTVMVPWPPVAGGAVITTGDEAATGVVSLDVLTVKELAG